MVLRRRVLAWLILVAYALTSAIWARGLVLCFEADGHVTLEAAASDCSGCCTGDGAADGPRAPRLGECSCLDLAIGVGTSAVQKLQPPEPDRSSLAVATWLPRDHRSPCAGATPARLPRSHASAALIFLHSVVLLV